ncbi:four helix bundle protein [Fibrobacter sp.]|uniref:four helix bundle protein n=1 Tax=Fibrobacter sp. TaxID=35828 RepID=UPI00388E0178
MAQSYKDLVVWQKAIDLTVAVYQLTKRFPKEELFGLVSQMRRASVSIASNIAEGEGRKSKKEFAHFLGISLGSKAELETQLILCERVGLASNSEISFLKCSLDEVGKMLAKLKERQNSKSKES